MKQKDFLLIGIIVFMSAIISYFASNALFSAASATKTAETVQPISADFPAPDSKYFNTNAFDPTQVITIGNNTNTDPFSATSNQ